MGNELNQVLLPSPGSHHCTPVRTLLSVPPGPSPTHTFQTSEPPSLPSGSEDPPLIFPSLIHHVLLAWVHTDIAALQDQMAQRSRYWSCVLETVQLFCVRVCGEGGLVFPFVWNYPTHTLDSTSVQYQEDKGDNSGLQEVQAACCHC